MILISKRSLNRLKNKKSIYNQLWLSSESQPTNLSNGIIMNNENSVAQNFDEDIDRSDAIKRFNYDSNFEELIWNLNFLAATEENFMSIGLTIIVDGVVLSGDLISSLEYYKIQANANKYDSDENFDISEERNAKRFRENKEYILEKINNKETFYVDYFHMKDSVILSGATCSDKGFLWRGKISDVSAFSFQKVVRTNARITVNHR